jgi:hypothetical protein
MSHLQVSNLSYFDHMKGAFNFSYQSLKASIFFFIHGLFPNYFIYTGSNIISSLNDNLQQLIINSNHNKFS